MSFALPPSVFASLCFFLIESLPFFIIFFQQPIVIVACSWPQPSTFFRCLSGLGAPHSPMSAALRHYPQCVDTTVRCYLALHSAAPSQSQPNNSKEADEAVVPPISEADYKRYAAPYISRFGTYVHSDGGVCVLFCRWRSDAWFDIPHWYPPLKPHTFATSFVPLTRCCASALLLVLSSQCFGANTTLLFSELKRAVCSSTITFMCSNKPNPL